MAPKNEGELLAVACQESKNVLCVTLTIVVYTCHDEKMMRR